MANLTALDLIRMKQIFKLLLDFGPATLTTGIALFYLVKDWESFKRGFLRWSVLILICLLWFFGIINTYSTDKKNDTQRIEDQKRIEALKSAVETANKNQADNTIQFVNAFGRLSQKVAILQTKVETSGLHEEADKLKTELKNTQTALIPPKARLAFTFNSKKTFKDAIPITSITLPAKNDIIHVEFAFLNPGNITARNGKFYINICEGCEFASEPNGFNKVTGYPKTREKKFDIVYSKVIVENMSADIKVPSRLSDVQVGVNYSCENCDTQLTEKDSGWIHLTR